MKTSYRPLLLLLVVVGLLTILTAVAEAKTESFSVAAGKELTQTINLNAGDRPSISLTVLGPAPSTLHFYIDLPNGTKDDYGEVSQTKIEFFTDPSGDCTLHFDNTGSSDPQPQLVTLNYEIEHYIFGMSSMVFMLVVITVLLMFVAAGYVLMGKYS